MFFVVFWIFPKKKPMFFFGFSRFLVLENLENPKNTMCFFWIFPVFIEKSKKHHCFFGFSLVFIEKSKNTYCFFLIFKVFAFGNS